MAAPEVMLAKTATPADIAALERRGFLFEPKIDGVRCVAVIENGAVKLFSRKGIDITEKYPEIVAALSALCQVGKITLDGEIACVDHRGFPSWPRTHKRDAQRRNFGVWAARLPATFYVFDVLYAGEDTRRRSYAKRREVLTALEWENGNEVQVVGSTPLGSALWKMCVEQELEGVVAKNPKAAYTATRSDAWLKIKVKHEASFLVKGYELRNRADTFGCLNLELLASDGKRVEVGSVGTGFSHKELQDIRVLIDAGNPVIVDVEYLDFSPKGSLRQPSFKRVRTDLSPSDCSLDQL